VRVHRTVKIGTGDEHGESELDETIEVHRFPDGVAPAFAKTGLSMRKSMQATSGDWIAGEITITANRPCYREELDDGTGFDASYDLVKDKMMVHLPKLLDAVNQLAKS